jgi:hypothetical protein
MEPQWNPSLEEQALARVYRIGQTQNVTTIRFLMKDSIEKVRIHSPRATRNGVIANVIDIVCDGHTRQEEGSHQYLIVGTLASVPPTAAGVTRLAQVKSWHVCPVFLMSFCCNLGCLKRASCRFDTGGRISAGAMKQSYEYAYRDIINVCMSDMHKLPCQ